MNQDKIKRMAEIAIKNMTAITGDEAAEYSRLWDEQVEDCRNGGESLPTIAVYKAVSSEMQRLEQEPKP